MKNTEHLTAFEKGQLDILKFYKDNMLSELADMDTRNLGYIIRETKKDIFYVAKMTIKKDIYDQLIELTNEKIEYLTEEE